VLVDASEEPGVAGSVSVYPVPDSPKAGSAFSHHVTHPLATARRHPFRTVARAVQVSIRVADIDPGTALSAPVEAGMPMLVDAVID